MYLSYRMISLCTSRSDIDTLEHRAGRHDPHSLPVDSYRATDIELHVVLTSVVQDFREVQILSVLGPAKIVLVKCQRCRHSQRGT